MSFQPLINLYVHGVMRQCQGINMSGIEMFDFITCRNEIKRRLDTVQWAVMGLDSRVINEIMLRGDEFLKNGDPKIALNFYREASYMFPGSAICYVREAQSLIALNSFDQAKRVCRKAIYLGGEYDFDEILAVLDIFIACGKLQEAHGLFLTLKDRFPHHHCFLEKVKEVETILANKKEEEQTIRNQKEKVSNKRPDGIPTGENVGQTSNKNLSEASGGTDQRSATAITQNKRNTKVVKTSKQLKNEQIARDKEIQQRIENAKREQEETLRKQEEKEARRKREREEKEEILRKQEEMEARVRREKEEQEKIRRKREEVEAQNERKQQEEMIRKREEDEKKMEKIENYEETKEHVLERSSKSSTGDDDTPQPRSSTLPLVNVTQQRKGKISLDDMRTDLDQTLSSGSHLRRVCTTCKAPRVFSQKNCDICKSGLLIWYRKVNTTNWINPRKPPSGTFRGRYVQCKNFRRGKVCATSPCTFAHGQDEVEYWELCRLKGKGGLKEHMTSVSKLQKSQSCMTLNGNASGTGLRSRSESVSSLRSLRSLSNPFELLGTEDTTLDDFDSDSSIVSQGVVDESSLQNPAPSTSSFYFDADVSLLGKISPRDFVTCTSSDPAVSGGQRDGGRMEVVARGKDSQKNTQRNFLEKEFIRETGSSLKRKRREKTASSGQPTKFRTPPDELYRGRYKLCSRFEKGRCFLGNKCTFAHGLEECSYWNQYQSALRKKQVSTESFSVKIRRRIINEGERHVLKELLPGVTVNCNSPLQVKLDGPQEYMWIFDVRIEKKYQLKLNQVAFLLETHLDKFKFLRGQGQNQSSSMESVQLLKKDFVVDSAKQKSVVQFCVQFSASVFGDFEQKLVFDFGGSLVLARSLYVSVVSEDICDSKDDPSSRTTYCYILKWSVEKMELMLCKDLMEQNSEQYCIPDDLPNPSQFKEFKRETYCELWHNMLFIEEKHIQAEVGRYDILDGVMKIVNNFQGANETVFALPGEFFGEIYLSDYLVMDEVAGHLINRSVTSVILRPKVELTMQSNRVYECSIKLKTSQVVIIKLNEALCEDYLFEKDQVMYIDLKFRYNRFLMCAMHQAIDRCNQKTEILLPDVRNISYTNKKSIHDWFMDRKPNTNQHEAIAMILDPNPTPPILVIGPFGTGKTFTLNLACVTILNQSRCNKVLICTHTNSAADIHLAHLDAKIEKKPSFSIQPIRIHHVNGNILNVPEKLRKYFLIEETTNLFKKPRWHEIRDRNVIITTLSSARMLWRFYQDGKLRFTHILIDEAAQALEPECLTPLAMADKKTKIVLAGDHMQMGPPAYSQSLWPKDFGPKRSLLERLHTHYQEYIKTSNNPSLSSVEDKPPYVVLLTENYRCHADILKFPSDSFYGGKLVARGDPTTCDLVPVLSFYTAQGVDQQIETSLEYFNEAEVAEVVKRVEELIQLVPKDWSKNIGVLAPYRDQVKRIRDGLRKKGLGYVDVEKVENVQGKEFKALFISTVRTMWTCSQIEGRNQDVDPSELDFGFLSDPRFLNTAVTRAQSLLAVVGDPMSLCSVGACKNLWKDYLQRCNANKGLHGCTLKTVMDFCLSYQPLNPSAHEFTSVQNIQDVGTLSNTSSKDEEVEALESSSCVDRNEVAREENDVVGSVSISHEFSSTATASQNMQYDPGAVVSGSGDFAEGSQNDRDEDVVTDEDDLENNYFVSDNFFRPDNTNQFDKIIEELVKACDKTKKADERCRHQKASNEDFPSLNDVPQARATSRWSNTKRAFSAGLKDGKIELGFHIKESETLFRLTGGKVLFKENGDYRSCHDIDTHPPEELLKLVEDNPTVYVKCTLRVSDINGQKKYYGQLATPDSPDIDIPGQVCGVFDGDVIVLELEQRACVHGNEQHEEEVLLFGYIKGVVRRFFEPRERKFVCTADRGNPNMMLPVNKTLPKLANFTKTDEKIIPIYKLKGEEVTEVAILSKNHYKEALAGERVFVLRYLSWRPDCPYPLGLAVKHVPHGKDFETGMEILYEEYNVRRNFSWELRTIVMKDFDENWQIPESEKGRPVYQENVFTVDPPESLDLDDAISIQLLDNGNYDLHVHIADVSYFVEPDTPLDKEAKLRGTSYYPPDPDENVPMLPRELSKNCCSLLPRKDRLAVTVSVEMKADGTIVGGTRIARSIVCSSSRLTYLEAQRIIDSTSTAEVLINKEARQIPVEEAVCIIHRIAQERRKVRLGFERSLYGRKRDDCDEDIDNEREAHQMIEEIMVMANHLVANYLLMKFPKCTPLRVQPPPKTRHVVEWRKKFQKFINFSLGLEWLEDAEDKQEETIEFKMPVKTWSMIMTKLNENCSFQEIVRLVCDVNLFPQLAIASEHQQQLQQKTRYICSGETYENIPFPWPYHGKEAPTDQQSIPAETTSENMKTDAAPAHPVNASSNRELNNILRGHYRLRLDAYCHFTSPIRRYIDIAVHRLVVASIEEQSITMDPDDMTTLCDRCTLFDQNSRRFDKDARKLQKAFDLKGSFRFVSAFIDQVVLDELKLFFGTGEFKSLCGESVRIARLGPDKNPEPVADHIKLRWTCRFLRLEKNGRAQPKIYISDHQKFHDLPRKLTEDDDFDYTVSGEHWKEVLGAVKNQNEDQLRSLLQELNGEVQKQRKPKSFTRRSLQKRLQDDSDSSSKAPYQHPNAGKPEPSEKETEEFFEITRSFQPFDRVKVQLSPQMNGGVLSPSIQLFKIASEIHACVEHRSHPTTCFAKIPHNRPTNAKFYNIAEYVRLWKPVLMLEIVTSAVREDDVIILSNLRVSFARDSMGLVTIEFSLSREFCKNNFLNPLDLNLMCVRVKDPDGSDKDTGYWVGHFQISDELRMKEDARKILEEFDGNASIHKEQARKKKNEYRPVLAQLMQSSIAVPESLITQGVCYVTAELISLSVPNRRRRAALVDSVKASKLIQDICIGEVSTEDDVGRVSLPKDLSLFDVHASFHPLNRYQKGAVEKALSKSFTLIQGPPGTGKTVTGVHIAYWFAQLNKSRAPTVETDGEKSSGSMVFYCGPSNKSVDVVGRHLIKIPGLKILRIYGQEVERKVFPVPDKVSLYRSKRVAVQLNDDEALKDVSLHHVIRSRECQFAEDLKQYDHDFKEYLDDGSDAPLDMINKFNELKSKAEQWAITQTGVDVILATCTTAYSFRILERCKDFVCQCIIDECGMCIEAETLCAILGSNAKQVVLIGDHKQLQPIVQSHQARNLGLGISMFERYSNQAHMLKIQYRMHEELCEFPSKYFYEGKLETAHSVLNRTPDKVTWPNGDRYPFAFHHVEGTEETLVVTTDRGNENSKKNQEEIEKVVLLARDLTRKGIKKEDIVILSPYRAQCSEITENLKKRGLKEISAMSVVAAQGSEKDYVILSLVRSLPKIEIETNPSQTSLNEHLGFIRDEHQINVALTRAKRGLSIVGNANLIGVSSMWKALLEHYKNKRCFIKDSK